MAMQREPQIEKYTMVSPLETKSWIALSKARSRDRPSGTRSLLILIGHTGGGHLRAAEAVAEALYRRYGEAVAVEILDAVGEYGPFPFNRLADFYPWWIRRAARTWDWGYRLTDGQRRATLLLRLFWPRIWPRARRLLSHHAADVILSAHPLTNHPLTWSLSRLGLAIPMLTLVTDPVSVHPFWLSPDVDRCLVGSTAARDKAIACGLGPEQVRMTGLPVNPRFVDGLTDKRQARRALGWRLERPAVLLIGGGEGMGQLCPTARAIEVACPHVQLAIVTGRNRQLRERLAAAAWRIPTHVYGFVAHEGGDRGAGDNTGMPHLMSAADLLITKAGPGTLHEAFLAGLPMILNSAIPGQEEGNVRLVVQGGAGVWAPDPQQAASLVARWTRTECTTPARMAACSRALARPHAADAVAQEIWKSLTPMETSRTTH